jgi:hypothetical protein
VALAHKVAAFKKGGEADYVELIRASLNHDGQKRLAPIYNFAAFWSAESCTLARDLESAGKAWRRRCFEFAADPSKAASRSAAAALHRNQ